jgi:hypothetical protein
MQEIHTELEIFTQQKKIKILNFQQHSDLKRLATAQPITLLLFGFHYNTAYTAHTPLTKKESRVLLHSNTN